MCMVDGAAICGICDVYLILRQMDRQTTEP